jgi:hypothetical protein
VVGIESQHAEQFACAERDAGVNQPDQAVGKGDKMPGSILKQLEPLHAHNR